MSLDGLVEKTIRSRVLKEVELFLPPEYEISGEEWKEKIEIYNLSNRPVKLAGVIAGFIQRLNPTAKMESIFSIGKITEKNGRYVTDMSFENDKAGLTCLYIYTAEELRLVPVCTDPKGNNGINNVVLTYVPK